MVGEAFELRVDDLKSFVGGDDFVGAEDEDGAGVSSQLASLGEANFNSNAPRLLIRWASRKM